MVNCLSVDFFFSVSDTSLQGHVNKQIYATHGFKTSDYYYYEFIIINIT